MTAGAATLYWYRDPRALRFLATGFLPWLAGLSLAWEIGHLPLYTIWRDSGPAWIAYAVVHCTLGDVLIGSASLALALVVLRSRDFAAWRWLRIAAVTASIAIGYTVVSEWMNVTVLRSWEYSESMPMLRLGAFEVGSSPLLQWTLVPTAALGLANFARSD